MATITITGSTIREAGTRKDNRQWKFRSVGYQYGGGTGGVVTTGGAWQVLQPVAGVLTFTAEAGIAAYLRTPDNHEYLVRIPEEDAGLWDVIEAGIAFPPNTAQDRLDAAVRQYVETNRSDFRTRAVLITEGEDAGKAQWVDESDVPTGDPVEWSQVVSEDIASIAAAAAAPDAVDADLAARDITFTDEGSGSGYFSVGGVPVSGSLVPPAATWSGVAANPFIKTVDVENFRGGGLTDVEVIEAAFDALEAGGELKFGQGVTYDIDSAFEVDIAAKPNVFINGQGATLEIAAGVTGTAIAINGTFGDATTLTAAVVAGDSTLSVADEGTIQAGDLVSIDSDGEVFNYDRGEGIGRFKQEMARVKSVSEGTLVLEGRTWNTYSITGYTVTVQAVRPAKNVTIRDLKVVGAGSSYDTVGLSVGYFDGLTVENCTVENVGRVGLYPRWGFNAKVLNCTVTDCDYTGLGYGLDFLKVHHSKAVNCYGARNRHSFDTHQCRDMAYIGCVAEDDRSVGLSTHGSDVMKIIDCTARNCGGGILVRGTNNMIRGNHIYGGKSFADDELTGYHGITAGVSVPPAPGTPTGVGMSGTNLIIDNNYINLYGPTWGSGDVSAIRVYSPLYDARITNNKMTGFNGTGISIRGDNNRQSIIADNFIDCAAQYQPSDLYWGIAIKPTNTLSTCIATDIDIDRNTILGPVADSGIYVGGGPTTSPRSDDIRIRWNKIEECGDHPIHLDDGYWGSNVSVWGNETEDVKAVKLTLANWTVPPYIGAHGYGRSAQPLGVGHETGARMRPNNSYGPSGSTSVAALTLNRLTVVPVFVPRRVTINQLGVNVTTASGTPDTEGRVGIYADVQDGYGGYPGDLVSGSAGTVATDAVAFATATVDATLNPGLYWLAFVPQTVTCSTTTFTSHNPMVGYAASALTAGRSGYALTDVSGALPSTFTASQYSSGSAIAWVQLRVSAGSTL